MGDARVKRIVCCLDGTWNNRGDEAPATNVAKLAPLLLSHDAWGRTQVAGYIPGIASGRTETARFFKGAIGYGLEDQIAAAHAWLVDTYQPGDEIHLVGFSRGAYAARSLASFLTHFGLGKPDSETWFAQAWAEYRVPEEKRAPRVVERLRANAHPTPPIASLAVWDTVGNLANPFISGGPLSRLLAFHDMRLHENIAIALHALALDEVRGPFRPTLISLPADKRLAAHQHVEQVWFAGSHADVGGGYSETALSDITLAWMIERLSNLAGLSFDLNGLRALTAPDPLGPQHAGTDGAIFGWSAWLPYVRLVRQNPDAVSPTRRLMFGALRSSRLPSGEMSINERVHESAIARFGAEVEIHAGGQARRTIYAPRNLAVALAADGGAAGVDNDIVPP